MPTAVGELVVEGPVVARGYLNNEELIMSHLGSRVGGQTIKLADCIRLVTWFDMVMTELSASLTDVIHLEKPLKK